MRAAREIPMLWRPSVVRSMRVSVRAVTTGARIRSMYWLGAMRVDHDATAGLSGVGAASAPDDGRHIRNVFAEGELAREGTRLSPSCPRRCHLDVRRHVATMGT